jgi:hypothetical protein
MAVDVKNNNEKKVSPIDSEIFLVIFLMLLIVVVPLAISIWDIGTPIPGFIPPQIS